MNESLSDSKRKYLFRTGNGHTWCGWMPAHLNVRRKRRLRGCLCEQSHCGELRIGQASILTHDHKEVGRQLTMERIIMRRGKHRPGIPIGHTNHWICC